MTGREKSNATKRGENARQSVMARLATHRRRYKLVMMITLGKRNHPDELQVKPGQKKLSKEEMGSLWKDR